MERVTHDLTDEQWIALKESWVGCAYCGVTDKPLQRDCVQALAVGGRYTLQNIVPACRSCNTSKSRYEVTGWLRRKRLDESVFLLRHAEISKELELRFPGANNAAPVTRETAAPRTRRLRYPVRKKRRRGQPAKLIGS